MIFGIRLRARLTFLLFLLVLGGCFQSTPVIGPQSTSYLPQEREPLKRAENSSSNNSVIVEEVRTITAITDLWKYFQQTDYVSTYPEIAGSKFHHHATVQAEIKRLSENQHYFNLISENARPYLKHIIEQIESRNLPLFLALVPAIESSYRADVTSSYKAAGLWQFIPSTGKHFGLTQNWWYDGRRDVVASTQAALDFLEELHDQFEDWSLALAAYNSGSGTVANAIRKNKKLGKDIDYWSLDLPPETKNYIPKLIALSSIIYAPSSYNISLPEISNNIAILQVNTQGQIQLEKAAELANIDLESLKKLNAAQIRWATDPEGSHTLLLPAESANLFESRLSALPDGERITWRHHTIKSGESLSTIAQKYRISVDVLKMTNKIDSSLIKIGKQLLVPDTSSSHDENILASNIASSAVLPLPSLQIPSLQDNKYRIKNGDSLWLIARRFNIHVQQILDWNDISKDHPLIPGKELKILLQKPILKTAAI